MPTVLNEPRQPSACIDDEAHRKADASIYPEAYGRVDANGHRWPAGCSYPPHALTQTADFQTLKGKACDEAIAINQWDGLVRFISEARALLRSRTFPKHLQDVLDDAAKALGPSIGLAVRRRGDHEAEQAKVREQLRIMEAEWRAAHPKLDSERYSGLGAEEFEKQFGKGAA